MILRLLLMSQCILVVTGLHVLLLSWSASFADYTAPIVSVLDGNTIEVLHNQYPERVHLSGIDCPEKGQAYAFVLLITLLV